MKLSQYTVVREIFVQDNLVISFCYIFMGKLEPRKYLTLEFLFELNNFYPCNIMYIILYGARTFLFAVDFCNITSSASTALLAEEIACELMTEESDPLGLGKPSFGTKQLNNVFIIQRSV